MGDGAKALTEDFKEPRVGGSGEPDSSPAHHALPLAAAGSLISHWLWSSRGGAEADSHALSRDATPSSCQSPAGHAPFSMGTQALGEPPPPKHRPTAPFPRHLLKPIRPPQGSKEGSVPQRGPRHPGHQP